MSRLPVVSCVETTVIEGLRSPTAPHRPSFGQCCDVGVSSFTAGAGPRAMCSAACAPQLLHNGVREDEGTCRRWPHFAVEHLWSAYADQTADSPEMGF